MLTFEKVTKQEKAQGAALDTMHLKRRWPVTWNAGPGTGLDGGGAHASPPFPHTPFEPAPLPRWPPPPVGGAHLVKTRRWPFLRKEPNCLSLRSLNAPPTPEPSPRAPVSLEQSPRWRHPYFRESIKALPVRASTAITRKLLRNAARAGRSPFLHTLGKYQTGRPALGINLFIP